MEIRLKTAEEFRDAHMTIEIRATRDEAWWLSDRLYTADQVGDLQASEAELVAAPLRVRVTELEAELERYRRAHVCVSDCKPNSHVAFIGNALVREWERAAADESERADRAEKSLAESRELVAFKERVADEIDQEADRLRGKVRELAEELATERKRRAEDLAEVETQRDRLIGEANAQEGLWTEERRVALQSIGARDRLLAAATTRNRAALEILGARRVAEAADDIVTTKGAILSDAIRNALAALSA